MWLSGDSFIIWAVSIKGQRQQYEEIIHAIILSWRKKVSRDFNVQYLKEIKKIYQLKKGEIIKRLNQFKNSLERQPGIDIFAELAFCILTPQSKAKSCWRAVEGLLNKGLLLKGNILEISGTLEAVRFKNKKAGYIINARRLFCSGKKISIKPKLKQFKNIYDARQWLVENVKGFGYKEASHFLRNIGIGEELAILDRHILKNLKMAGLIDKIPENLSKKKYLYIENEMRKFSKKIKIPLGHLDLLMWCRQTGEVFK